MTWYCKDKRVNQILCLYLQSKFKKETEDWSKPEEEADGLVMKSVFLCQFAPAIE